MPLMKVVCKLIFNNGMCGLLSVSLAITYRAEYISGMPRRSSNILLCPERIETRPKPKKYRQFRYELPISSMYFKVSIIMLGIFSLLQ